MNSRQAAAIMARARSTLILIEAAETQARCKRLFERAAPTLVYKQKDNALIKKPPRLRYRTQADARLWR
jgi:hypothetical protein